MSLALSKLHEQAEIIMGQSPPGNSYNAEGVGMPLLNGPTEFGPVHPTEQQWTIAPTKLCKAGDILFCVRGATAGRTNIADKQYCLGRGLAAVRAKPNKFDSRFLHYVLAAGYARFQSQGVGSTFINISADMLSNFDVPIMPLNEQRRIAAILDQADDLRLKRREALSRLTKLSGYILVEACGEPASNPMNWPISRLGNVCSSVSDGPHVSPEYAEDGVPFLSTRNIRPDGILWRDLKFISKADAQIQWKKIKPSRGDVLYTKGGTTGIARAVDFDLDFAVWVHVAVLKLLKDKVEPVWLQEMLNSPYCYHQSQRLTKGIVNRDLGLRRMVDITFPLPPVDLQRAIASRVAEIDELTVHHRAHLVKLDALFASLQNRAFRGEL